MDPKPFDLSRFPVHLGLGARAVPLPEFTGDMDWFAQYAARHGEDGPEGRLIMMSEFTESWATWEVHPKGEELVVCLSGQITLYQEVDGETRTATLTAGQAIVNPAGVWHTADVEEAATALFITAGEGTTHRPR